jgi:hypothetical protein
MHELCILLNVWCRLCFLSETECRLCFLSETECIFLSSSHGWADISLLVATVAPSSDGRTRRQHTRRYTVASSSDGRMTSAHPSLLGTIVDACVFCPLLLCHHCSGTVVAMDRLPVTTVAYDPLLQWLFVVVILSLMIDTCTHDMKSNLATCPSTYALSSSRFCIIHCCQHPKKLHEPQESLALCREAARRHAWLVGVAY